MIDGFIKTAAASPAIRVADCVYNTQQICVCMKQATKLGAKLLVLPELCITGSTCGDLFLHDTLLDQAEAALREITAQAGDTLTFVGLPVKAENRIYSAVAAVHDKKLLAVIPKAYIDGDEARCFSPAPNANSTISIAGFQVPFGTDILLKSKNNPSFCVACEVGGDSLSPEPPSVRHTKNGAVIIVNPSANSADAGKARFITDTVSALSGRLKCGYIYADAGYGESTTDLVFDGQCLIGENGVILNSLRFRNDVVACETDIQRLNFERRNQGFKTVSDDRYTTVYFDSLNDYCPLTRTISCTPFVPEDKKARYELCEEVLTLQSLALAKRLQHTNAKCAVLGISGGLDSTLALLVCARTMRMLRRPLGDIVTVTMPCFGTTARTKSNAQRLCECLGTTFYEVDITASVRQHFADIGHDETVQDVTFENAQARERTQVIMDIANKMSGLVIGTGDLSELALGWATYNGDHMSMYGVNASIPKTLIRHLVEYEATVSADETFASTLRDILDTPVSPELLAPKDGEIAQKTEEIVGPYILHDFFLYYAIKCGFEPKKVYRVARYAFAGKYDDTFILKWLKNFYRRFFSQQFKRSCMPDGPKVLELSLSPRGGFKMPSDAIAALWLNQLEML